MSRSTLIFLVGSVSSFIGLVIVLWLQWRRIQYPLPSWLAYIRAYFRAPKHARDYVMDALFMMDKDLGGVGPTGCKIEIYIEPEGSRYGGGSLMTPLNRDMDDVESPHTPVSGNTVTGSSTPTYFLTINNPVIS